MKKRKGLIIVPAYNEEKNLTALIPELKSFAPELDVLVVNDNSNDDTSATARELGARVIDLPCNLGYGGAVQTGFKYGVKYGYDFCIQVDGDGQHDPRSINTLIYELSENNVDVVLGSRFLGETLYEIPITRRIGMFLFAKVVRLVTGMKITDPTTGYQCMNARVMRFFADDNYPIDYPDADTLIVLSFAGFTLREAPVTIRGRNYGVSMHNNFKAIYYVLKMLMAIGIVVLRGRKYYLKNIQSE